VASRRRFASRFDPIESSDAATKRGARCPRGRVAARRMTFPG
jgi:hypothetical protein